MSGKVSNGRTLNRASFDSSLRFKHAHGLGSQGRLNGAFVVVNQSIICFEY